MLKKQILRALPILVILAGAYLVRRQFIRNRPQAPVVWDAAGYNIQGRKFIEAFREWPDREIFRKNFRQAYDLALPKGEVYPLFLSAIYAFPKVNFQTVRLVQAALGALSLWLLYLIAARVYNRTVALMAIAVSAVYPPYIFSEARLLTETLGIFILLLTVWLLVMALESRHLGWLIVAGISAAILVVSRTIFQYSFIFFWVLLAAGLAVKRRRLFFLKSLLFLLGLGMVLVPRMVGTARTYGQPYLSGSWRSGEMLFGGIYPPNQGFTADGSPGAEFIREVRAESPAGTPIDTIYVRAYTRILTRQPSQALPVVFAKGYLFWRRAYNDFLQSYILSPGGADIFTRFLLILGLWGLCATLGRGPKAWPVLGAAGYIWSVCFLTSDTVRHTLPAIPLNTIAGAWFLFLVFSGLKSSFRGENRRRGILTASIAASVFLFVLAAFVRPQRVLYFFPRLYFSAAFSIWVAVAAIAVLGTTFPIYVLVSPRLGGWRRIAAAILPPVVILAVFFSALKVHPHWQEWKVRLRNQGDIARQTVYLPPDLESYRSAEIKLDLLSGPGRDYDLIVRVDGVEVRCFERGLVPDPGSYIANRRAFPIFLREQRRRLNQVRQWYTIPVDIREFKGREIITVEVEFSPRGIPGEEDWVDIWGDWDVLDDPHLFRGPTFSQSPGELSLYRYLFDDDWRIWRETELHARSEIDADESRRVEAGYLSPIPSGRYRIYLLLSPFPPAALDFPVALRGEEYLTPHTTPAHYFDYQLWELNPWKRKSDRMRLEAAHAAPGEEGGFKLVIYADTNEDGRPDRLVLESPYFTAEKKGEWSSWEFSTAERRIFVGMAWPRSSPKTVYYERARWPHDLFPETMFYTIGPNAAIAGPVITNLRLDFLPD